MVRELSRTVGTDGSSPGEIEGEGVRRSLFSSLENVEGEMRRDQVTGLQVRENDEEDTSWSVCKGGGPVWFDGDEELGS